MQDNENTNFGTLIQPFHKTINHALFVHIKEANSTVLISNLII